MFSGKKVPGKGWSRGAYIGPCSIVRVAYRVVVKEHVKGCVRSMQGDNVGMQGDARGHAGNQHRGHAGKFCRGRGACRGRTRSMQGPIVLTCGHEPSLQSQNINSCTLEDAPAA